MSEPSAVAPRADEVAAGVWHWSVEDDRIGGFISAAHAVRGDEGVVLIDPLPLEPDALERLGPVEAIVLTCGTHQRSCWRYRRELGARVFAPDLVREVDEEPDVRYREGDQLPAGLRPIFAPGPGTTQHVLMLEREPRVLFAADHFVRPRGRELGFVPSEFVYDPEQTRQAARRLLELEFDVLCLGHGVPVTEDPHAAIRDLLERDAGP